MLYGELGKFEIHSIICKRMVNFWSRLVTGKKSKFSHVLYSLINQMSESTTCNYNSRWICKVKEILNLCGLSYFWLLQSNHDPKSLKSIIDRRMNDMDLQTWNSDVNKNSLCYNYRIIKNTLHCEQYLIKLDFSSRLTLAKFRCGNIKMPSNCRFSVENNDKLCKLCTDGMLGDEFHYLFECKHFDVVRKKYLNPYYYKHPSTIKTFELFNTNSVLLLTKLCKFIQIIAAKFM